MRARQLALEALAEADAAVGIAAASAQDAADALNIEAALRQVLENQVDDLQAQVDDLVARMTPAALPEDAGPSVLDDEVFLGMAIERQLPIRFAYTDRDGSVSDRLVSPYEVIEPVDTPLVFGWDHGREGLRQFHVTRIDAPSFELVEPFVAPERDHG